ncbi:hypothetical protein LTR62_008432 [Meristemomyces frigidus]|uniref:F-box domain-containing protein n=1 Tax=Meristemomyces frigidus TaxID=1508187 RepID=A0AAN7T9H5_9PEZI|nr:hypothetical protein LTR62_008432 [Meristemomyces frigidus]
MARIIDLETDEDSEPRANIKVGGEAIPNDTNADSQAGKPGINVGLFSAALTCYPIVTQLARSLDLNSLHELSRTCRQFRAHLLQYRPQLIEHSLRCENEGADPAARLGNALYASFDLWTTHGRDGVKIGRVGGGKLGACARDLIAVSRSVRSGDDNDVILEKTVARLPCTCATQFLICQPCGQRLRSNDTTYTRGWAWRTRYKTCGGFGAGLGEGNEGVECGRGADCQEVQEVYHESECDADELETLGFESTQAESQRDGRRWGGSSYLTQEVVGIGGAVKKKIKRRVLVGAAVKEYEDERKTGSYLVREQKGVNRSWCSWCERVILGVKDVEDPGRSSDSVATASSEDGV